MWIPRTSPILVVLVAIAVSLWVTGTARADGPTDGGERTFLQALPSASRVSGQESMTLSARLYTAGDQAVSGVPLTFYVLTDVFGERLMKVGGVTTDATGTASLVYRPTWEGDHTVVIRFNGGHQYLPAQTSFQFGVTGPVPVHENAPFGLEPVRRWLPLTVGMVVLAVWISLGLVMARTVQSMRGEAAVAVPAPIPMPLTEPPRPAPLGRALVLVAALALLALPTAWLLTRGPGKEASLPVDSARFAYQLEEARKQHERDTTVEAERSLPATLVQSIPAINTDAEGRITLDSADLPADVARIDDRVFVLDTNNGRILAVTSDGELAPILESERSGDRSLWGAMAMTAHGGRLYVANSVAGNVLVVTPSGRIEAAIKPQVPEGQRPLRPAGIAVTDRGEVWLSDSNNHRILFLDAEGQALGVIGEGTQSSGEYGFNTPGGLALDHQGNLLVADTNNREVKKYSPMGVFLMALGEGRLAEPEAVSVDERGDIYVSDDKLPSVLVFEPDGSYLGSIGLEDSADGESRSWLQSPHGLKIDGRTLYVMDRLSGLLIFRLEGNDGS